MNMFEYYGYFGVDNNSDILTETESVIIDHLFDKYLPQTGRVLDSCAGLGENAFKLAEKGYVVSAVDFIEDHTESIKNNPRAAKLEGVYCTHPRNLPMFENEAFDAVISLGTMYHLRKNAEREVFVRESLRVLKPGGVFAFSYMTPTAITLGQFFNATRTYDPQARVSAYRKLATVEKNQTCDMFYGMTLEEMTELSREYGIEICTVASTYGMLYNMADEIAAMSAEEYKDFVDCQIKTCEDPFTARYCMRGLFIGKKKVMNIFD